jgi:hypothetical protein
MLRGQTGRQWRGTFDLHFNHHSDLYSLERSARMGCCICRIIWDELTEHSQGQNLAKAIQRRLRSPRDPDPQLNSTETNSTLQQQSYFVRAFLSHIHGQRSLYRLDFRLVDFDSKILATFLLEQTSECSTVSQYDFGLTPRLEEMNLHLKSTRPGPTAPTLRKCCS